MNVEMEKINGSGELYPILIVLRRLNFTMAGRDRPILRDLTIHVITSVATRWYNLGLVLLDTKYENELNIIEADIRNDAVTCCRKMFSKWLNTDELASWDKLIKAVRIVQLNNVANDIEQLLLQGEYVTDLPLYDHH